MLKIGFCLIVLLMPMTASANPLTKQEYFELYARFIPRALIAQRMEQLYDQLSAGDKTTAKGVLKQDLLDVLGNQLTLYQDSYVTPTTQNITDVNDTTLP